MTVLTDLEPPRTTSGTRLVVGWAATDVNGHMRSTAYLDAVNDCRVRYFHECGWPIERFHAQRIGPVLLGEQIVYSRELRMGDVALVDQCLAGLGPDGCRWRLRNVVRRQADDVVAATVTSDGAWMDLDRRCLVEPPAELMAVLLAVAPAADIAALPPLNRAGA
jgi:acyl-CoA thioester hydrolase